VKFVDTIGKPGIHEDEFGKFIWQPRGDFGFNIVRVEVKPEGCFDHFAATKSEEKGVPRTSPADRLAKTKEYISKRRALSAVPKQVGEKEMIPEDLRFYFHRMWAREQAELEKDDRDRLRDEARKPVPPPVAPPGATWWHRIWRRL